MRPTEMTTHENVYELARQDKEIERFKCWDVGPTAGDAVSYHLSLPMLRAFWPMSSVDAGNGAIDVSGQARHLTNGGAAGYSRTALDMPYATFTGGSTSYLTRADEAGLDVTGQLTLGGWFYFNAVTGVNFCGKTGASGSYAYGLQTSGSAAAMYVSTNGTTVVSAVSSLGVIQANRWHFIVGRYVPSTELAVYYDAVKTSNITSIPASINNSTAAFQIGGASALSQFMNGNAGLVFLCATSLSDTQINVLLNTTRLFFGI